MYYFIQSPLMEEMKHFPIDTQRGATELGL